MEAIFIGAIFLEIRLTVRVYPNILAEYGNLSQKERETAETNGLPFYGFLLFTAMGVINLLSYGVSLWLNDPNISSKIILIATLIGAVIAVVGGNYLKSNRIN